MRSKMVEGAPAENGEPLCPLEPLQPLRHRYAMAGSRRRDDGADDGIPIFQNRRCGNAQRHNPVPCEKVIARGIVLAITVMKPAVDLHTQRKLPAEEVQDVATEWVLAAKLESDASPPTQGLPEHDLRKGHLLAQFPGSLDGCGWRFHARNMTRRFEQNKNNRLRVHRTPLEPPPPPPAAAVPRPLRGADPLGSSPP